MYEVTYFHNVKIHDNKEQTIKDLTYKGLTVKQAEKIVNGLLVGATWSTILQWLHVKRIQ